MINPLNNYVNTHHHSALLTTVNHPIYNPGMKYKTLDQLPDILISDEVCSIFRISKSTLYRWERMGKIQVVRVGFSPNRRYRKSDIIKILNTNSL